MEGERRSGCPINLTVEMLCDRWSLIVLRGPMFGNRRHYRKLLTRSEEGISTNILADRLRMLMDEGMITKANDATHKPKSVYSLTEKAIALVPIFAQPGDDATRRRPRNSASGHGSWRKVVRLCGTVSCPACARHIWDAGPSEMAIRRQTAAGSLRRSSRPTGARSNLAGCSSGERQRMEVQYAG
jgi:DNA-binding HxlR family transcriptional regulator